MKAIDKYDDALRAVALATTVPEAKEWRDKAEAMTHWAKRAKNKKLLQDAIEIKMEAERRGGRLLIEMAGSGERKGRGQPKKVTSNETTLKSSKLADLGVSRDESSRWQSYAQLPADEWDSKKRHIKGIAVATLEGDTEVVKAARAEGVKKKKARRKKRETELAEKIIALPDKKFGVIVEDYEWDHKTWSESGKDRHASNHYPTSKDAHTAAEIVERTKDRFDCAADDCVLFMWTTSPHLAIALDVMRQRGFEYKSTQIWGKDKIGTGYWFRNKHEQWIVGTRGNIPAPAQGDQWDSLIIAPRGKHSAKPERFLEMIEQYFPNLPKIELNARKARKGWSRWGNEAPEAEAAE